MNHYFKVSATNDEVSRIIGIYRDNIGRNFRVMTHHHENGVPISTILLLVPMDKINYPGIKKSSTNNAYDPCATLLAYKLGLIGVTELQDIFKYYWPKFDRGMIYGNGSNNLLVKSVNILCDIAQDKTTNKYSFHNTIPLVKYMSDNYLLNFLYQHGSTRSNSAIHIDDGDKLSHADKCKIILNRYLEQYSNRLETIKNSNNISEYDSTLNMINTLITAIYAIINSDYICFQKFVEILLINNKEIKRLVFSLSSWELYDAFYKFCYFIPEDACRAIRFVCIKMYYDDKCTNIIREIFSNGSELFLMPLMHVYNLRPLIQYITDPKIVSAIKKVTRKYSIRRIKAYKDIVIVCKDYYMKF